MGKKLNESSSLPNSKQYIGIDFGTTNTRVAYLDGENQIVVRQHGDSNEIPSVVRLKAKGEQVVGRNARFGAASKPKNFFTAIKRLAGKRFKEAKSEAILKAKPYEVIESENGDAWIRAPSKDFSPSQINAFILKEAISSAETAIGEKISKAAVSIPTGFNDSQRQAIRDSCRIAGLDSIRLVSAPLAAGLAYAFRGRYTGNVVVVDHGGGTLDISVIEIGDGVFETKATGCSTSLGGEEFDLRIVNHLAEAFLTQVGFDPRLDKQALIRLWEAAEQAKIDLTDANQTAIDLPYLIQGYPDSRLYTKLTRDKFEMLSGELVQQAVELCNTALADSGLKIGEVDHLIMVGGMSRVPAIRSAITRLFNRSPGGGAHPYIATAQGLAIQGGVMGGSIKDVLLFELTPMSLGIETLDGVFTRMIDRHTIIPTRKAQTFSTAEDDQSAVSIRVFQGENEKARDNHLLGEFDFVDIPPVPRGMPQIEVAFGIDPNGIVSVSARDKSTGKEQEVVIRAPSGLTEAQVENMAADLVDRTARLQHSEAHDKAANLVAAVEAALDKYHNELSPKGRHEIESALEDLRKALDDEEPDITTLQALYTTLLQASQKLMTSRMPPLPKSTLPLLPLNESLIEDISPQNDGSPNQDSEIPELVQVLNSKISALEKRVESGESSNQDSEIQESIQVLNSKISALEKRIEEVTKALENKAKEKHPNFTVMEGAIDAASRLSPKDLDTEPEGLKDTVEKSGLLFPNETYGDLSRVLKHRKPILLVGPPGTGKSSLCRALALAAFGMPVGDDPEEALSSSPVNQHEISVESSSSDILGNAWVDENNQPYPWFGHLTHALIDCIESGGERWLLLDEISRAEPGQLTSGLNNVFETIGSMGAKRYFDIPGFHQLRLPIPETFRVVMTSNSMDPVSHRLPSSFVSRCETVEIGYPRQDVLAEILKRTVDRIDGEHHLPDDLVAEISAACRAIADAFEENGLFVNERVLISVRTLKSEIEARSETWNDLDDQVSWIRGLIRDHLVHLDDHERPFVLSSLEGRRDLDLIGTGFR